MMTLHWQRLLYLLLAALVLAILDSCASGVHLSTQGIPGLQTQTPDTPNRPVMETQSTFPSEN
jgi:hypothetical protein